MLHKPSEKEEEFFKRQELEKLRKLREETARTLEEEERQRLKKLHWMRCPKCGMELHEVELQGVMVDTCLDCGGTFFDEGEVMKILSSGDSGFLKRLRGVLFGDAPTTD
ncbi:MAG: hypothetical protein GXP47_10055 [Acidobacteria bacterium]|nr:hypothetical protein [Acidobacteriota bacterium]